MAAGIFEMLDRTWTYLFFFLNDTAPTEIYTLPLHDALPISRDQRPPPRRSPCGRSVDRGSADRGSDPARVRDRKSTRLNSSHSQISYAVFCLKKKKTAHSVISRGSPLHSQPLICKVRRP